MYWDIMYEVRPGDACAELALVILASLADCMSHCAPSTLLVCNNTLVHAKEGRT